MSVRHGQILKMLTDDCLALVHMCSSLRDRVHFVLTCRRFRDAIDNCGLPHDYETWLKQQPSDYVETLPVQITVYGARMSHVPLRCLVDENRRLTIMHNYKPRVVDTRKLRVYDGCFTKTKPVNIKLDTLTGWLEIGNDFLTECPLPTLDLKPLSCVTRIGRNFLYCARLLTYIDLSPLDGVTHVGHCFLYCCSGLTSLDLRPLRNLRVILDDFLAGCTGITALDLTPLSNVIRIGAGFLQDTGIEHLDTTPLINAEVDTELFLYGCANLRTVNLVCFRRTTEIRTRFLADCGMLESVDLSVFANVTRIGSWFMSTCTGLQQLDMSPMRQLVEIDNYFLVDCALVRISFDGVTEVTAIGDDFMSDCTALQRIDLSRMSKIQEFGIHFLEACTSLREALFHKAFSDIYYEYVESDDDYRIQCTSSFMYNCPSQPSFDP